MNSETNEETRQSKMLTFLRFPGKVILKEGFNKLF